MPLFKPVSIAMWPALMPLLQFVHWQANRKKPLDQYQDRVLPGTQPFAMNWISLIYAYLIGVCWITYMMATLVFLPLFLMSSWAIIPALWFMPFIFCICPSNCSRGAHFVAVVVYAAGERVILRNWVPRARLYNKVGALLQGRPRGIERSIWDSGEYTENESGFANAESVDSSLYGSRCFFLCTFCQFILGRWICMIKCFGPYVWNWTGSQA